MHAVWVLGFTWAFRLALLSVDGSGGFYVERSRGLFILITHLDT